VSKIEHPVLRQIMKTGYPENVAAQPENCGRDYFGEEILENEDIVIDGDDTILKHNLERYLSEVYGMTFQTIK